MSLSRSVLSKFTSSSSRLYFSSIEGTLSDTKELNISACSAGSEKRAEDPSS
jgi:hypothetical protein